MQHILKRSFVLLLTLIVLSSSLAFASPEIMTVDQISPGMRGVAKTVVSGTKIEEFGVEVLGVMKDKGPSGDLILVRTSGDVIDRTGGIAQGMSGSPVYIDGKLVGAIAYGWSLTDHKVGMVTPITDMLKLWDMPDTRNIFPADDAAPAAPAGTPEFEPFQTPLMVSGFTEAAVNMMRDKLAPFQLVPYAVGEAPAGTSFGPLEPGSSVGVQMVGGDFSVGALGTVTYAEGDKVLAFGHPFLKKGNVNYLMTNSYIFTTVSGLENSFKIGTSDTLVGIVNQDRGVGLAGRVGRYPVIAPMLITVRDNDLNRADKYAVQVVQDEQLTPLLSAVTVFNAITKTMDRTGPGTAKVSFEITGRDLPGDKLVRENMFYSPASVGELAIGEFLEAMTTIAGNRYHPVTLMDVKINVSVSGERRTATIMEAKPDAAKAKPGDTINITVKLKPFRGENITRVVPYTIPKDQKPGPMTLEVRGGGMIPLAQLLLKKQGLDDEILSGAQKKNQSFADMLNEFARNDRNNDIVVEQLAADANVLAPDTALSVASQDKPSKQSTTENAPGKNTAGQSTALSLAVKKNDEKSKSFLTTDYIVDGDAQIMIEISTGK